MSALRLAALTALISAAAAQANAASMEIGNININLGFDAYADVRAVVPSGQTGWVEGGLGKLRYGDGSSDPELHLGEIFAEAHLQIGGSLLAVGTVRIEPTQKTLIDFTEAYLRYRPVSLSRLRWTLRAGAFFPPVSLENTDIGWASPWTLTWSAINSWVGEELRTIGGEARVEWRGDARTFSAVGSVYGWNDPAGILVADRGWALHDRVTGLLDRPRLPDAWARPLGRPIPSYTHEFIEIDERAGWYAGVSWDENRIGRFEILRYHNEADPSAERIQVAWLTEFTSAGFTGEYGDFVVIAQGLRGRTLIEPSPFFFSDTDFESAFFLLGWHYGTDWRFAGRAEVFSTNEERSGTSINLSEHGHAFTGAANWLPNEWLRLTAEIVHVVSTRRQRIHDGIAPRQKETQFQLGARFYY